MVQQPDRITFLYLRDHEVRHVRLNEAHPAQATPSWYGNSVGHYEGDALVIDTVGIKTDRPFAMIDMFGTPFSQALHVVERYRLIDYADAKATIDRNSTHNTRIAEVFVDPSYRGKHLQIQLSIEDKGVFTMPWAASITYSRLLGHGRSMSAPKTLMNITMAGIPSAGRGHAGFLTSGKYPGGGDCRF